MATFKPYREIETGEYAPWFKPLRDLIPLATPLTVLIDPTNHCNLACQFCPTGHPEVLAQVNRSSSFMSFSCFKKAIGDLGEFPDKVRKLMLNKDGEPFVHSDLEKMIAFAKKKNVASSVEISTNGFLVTRNRARRILDAGLDAIRFSIEHVHDKGYFEITNRKVKYETVRCNVETFWNEKQKSGSGIYIHAKILDVGLTQEEKEKFIRDFSPIVDSLNIDSLMKWDGGAPGVDLGIEARTGMDGKTPINKGREVCPEPFKFLAVNPNGSVSPCCVDWSYRAAVGNILEKSLFNIWNGERMRNFRRLHLERQRKKHPICANCTFFQGQADYTNIDDISSGLLEQI